MEQHVSDKQIIINHRKNGKTMKEIGLIFGVSRQRIHQILTSRAIKPKIINCYACNHELLDKRPRSKRRKFCSSCSAHLRGLTGGRERTREIVRIRDNHTCQKCGLKWNPNYRRFDIHHLNGLCGKKSRSYDRIKDVNGLITLCHSCHMNLDEVRKKISLKSSPRQFLHD